MLPTETAPVDQLATPAPEDQAATAAASGEANELDLGYRVELSGFSGPLDLLLYLVRKAEVDITEVSIAQIADQFLATVEAWEELDLDVAGDFILMAATLLEIKARFIVPPEEGDEEEDDEDLIDPRADLIQQLLAYRKVKEAVLELGDLERLRVQHHHRRHHESIPDDPDEAEGMDLDNADPYQLFAAWEKLLESIAGQSPRTVLYDDIPIEERMQQMVQLMSEAKEGRLSWLLEQVDSKVKRCGVVVATLEAIRQRCMEAIQHEQYGDVQLHFVAEEDRVREPVLPPNPDEEEPVDAEGKRKKRRRRKKPPLFTWQPPEGVETESVAQQVLDEAVEENTVVETEEQRFVRELNDQVGIDDLLGRMQDLDGHLASYLREQGIVEEAIETSADDGEASAEAGVTTEVAPEADGSECRQSESVPSNRTDRPSGADSSPGDCDDADDEDEYDDDEDDYDDDEDEYSDDDEDDEG